MLCVIISKIIANFLSRIKTSHEIIHNPPVSLSSVSLDHEYFLP